MKYEASTAIIAGTGLEKFPGDCEVKEISVNTPFGSVLIGCATALNVDFYYLPRHGSNHSIYPHLINYQANISALHQLGVRHILAVNAVGSLSVDILPGTLILFDNFLDFTKVRSLSYWSNHPNAPSIVIHTDFSIPYSERLRNIILSTATGSGIAVRSQATYVCVEGPRFESPAEVRMFAQLGGDVIGMTGLPEVTFAREAGIEYAGIGIVTNLGAGLSKESIVHENVATISSAYGPIAIQMLINAAKRLV